MLFFLCPPLISLASLGSSLVLVRFAGAAARLLQKRPPLGGDAAAGLAPILAVALELARGPDAASMLPPPACISARGGTAPGRSLLAGVGRGLVGAVTAPIGGALELVERASHGIVRAAGLGPNGSRSNSAGTAADKCPPSASASRWFFSRLPSLPPDLLGGGGAPFFSFQAEGGLLFAAGGAPPVAGCADWGGEGLLQGEGRPLDIGARPVLLLQPGRGLALVGGCGCAPAALLPWDSISIAEDAGRKALQLWSPRGKLLQQRLAREAQAAARAQQEQLRQQGAGGGFWQFEAAGSRPRGAQSESDASGTDATCVVGLRAQLFLGPEAWAAWARARREFGASGGAAAPVA